MRVRSNHRGIAALTVGALLCFTLTGPLHAQDASQPTKAEIYFTQSPLFASLLSDVSIGNYERLRAAVSVDSKSGKVTYAPINGGFLSAAIGLSSGEEKTTVGLSLKTNPRSPGGRIASEAWDAAETATGANRQFTQGLIERQRIEIKLRELAERRAAAEKGVKSGTPADPTNSEIAARLEYLTYSEAANDTLAELQKKTKDLASEKLMAYFDRLWSRCATRFSVAANFATFNTLSADSVDADSNGFDDYHYHLKSAQVLGVAEIENFGFIDDKRASLSGGLGYRWTRGSQDGDARLVESILASVSFALRLVSLNPEYRKTDDYMSKGFVPSVALGIAYEGEYCQTTDKLSDGDVKKATVLTPFIDVRIDTKAQFRLGLPFKRTETAGVAGSSETTVKAVTEFALSF